MGSTLFSDFIQKVKQALASLGFFIENGIAQVKELVAEKIFAQKVKTNELEMVDKATGEIYCTWIENGEWVKVKGECEENQQPPTEKPPIEEEPPVEEPPAEEPLVETCTPSWQCTDWQPLPETTACGQTLTQTRTCTDSNNCGTDEGKPSESQEAKRYSMFGSKCHRYLPIRYVLFYLPRRIFRLR